METTLPYSPQLITDISTKHYFSGEVSNFRRYQAKFLESYGAEITGNVVEIGGEKRYDHARFFPKASSFTVTNVGGQYDAYLDATRMGFADNSQDAFVCVSVLEHVLSIKEAFDEIHRTLKPNGALLMVIPFAYPVHDKVDYWRVSRSFYDECFAGYEVRAFVHLGGMFSTIVDVLQRPKGKVNKRFFAYKLLGFTVAKLFARFETVDGFPLGYGIYATKKP